ncbi:MAG: response regulator [Patescibacteria group bacterium]|nr:response regulator [Patescibacteria group bacterium]
MSGGKKNKVLIVEDDKALLDLYDKKFSHCGYEVIRAEDGQEGVEKAEKSNPDVILLDIMLPVMNGFEVLKKLGKNGVLEKTPVVILSNYGETKNITEGLVSGAVEYLIKVEHTPEEVVNIVEDALSEKESLIGKAFKESA